MAANYPPSVFIEEIACPIDGSTEYDVILIGRDLIYHIPGDFRVVRCKHCGLMRTSPRPTLETIGAYYPETYLPYETTRVQNDRQTVKQSGMKRLIKRYVNYNVDSVPDIPPGALLEIGCASGQYMHHMAKSGWRAEGIEPSQNAAAAARELGFDVYAGALETAPERQAAYDLIVGWMVLEHLHDPIGALKRLHRWTKPGGWAVFSVPNAGSLEFRVFGRYWFALQVPTHTFHYTPGTIEKVLLSGGWKLERIFHQRILTNVFISMGLWLKKHGWLARPAEWLVNFNRMPWRVHQLLYPLAWFLSLFGQTGRMTVWARRIDD